MFNMSKVYCESCRCADVMTPDDIKEDEIKTWQNDSEDFPRTDQCKFCREDKQNWKSELRAIEDTPGCFYDRSLAEK